MEIFMTLPILYKTRLYLHQPSAEKWPINEIRTKEAAIIVSDKIIAYFCACMQQQNWMSVQICLSHVNAKLSRTMDVHNPSTERRRHNRVIFF